MMDSNIPIPICANGCNNTPVIPWLGIIRISRNGHSCKRGCLMFTSKLLLHFLSVCFILDKSNLMGHVALEIQYAGVLFDASPVACEQEIR